MKNVKYLFLLPILLLSVSCEKKGESEESKESSSTSQSRTGSEQEELSFVPKVGEVRKLFDDGKAGETKIYNYCPSVFVENNEEHVYFCTNEIEGNVTDYIGYRKGTISNNNISYSDKALVLSHGQQGSWDSRHACDPSVIKGEFTFHNEKYSYLMAYLGCVPSNCTLNETGIAVSKKPEGPWVKCDYKLDGTTKINPIVPCSDFGITGSLWGTGQPSLFSVDGKGKVMLFTTIGSANGTFTNIREYDFSNIDNYQLIRERTKINADGVRYTSSGGNFINNADFAYDVAKRRVLMAKPRQFFGTDKKTPDFIADTIDVYYIDDTEGTNVGDVLFAGNNTTMQWKLIGSVNQSLTGFLRNHNCGLITDEFGHTLDMNRIGVAFTRSDEGTSTNWSYLSTYRIYATSFNFPAGY